MSGTHINAYMQDVTEALMTAQSAVQDAQSALDQLRAKLVGDNPQPTEPPKEAGPASEGEAQSKKKDVKYK